MRARVQERPPSGLDGEPPMPRIYSCVFRSGDSTSMSQGGPPNSRTASSSTSVAVGTSLAAPCACRFFDPRFQPPDTALRNSRSLKSPPSSGDTFSWSWARISSLGDFHPRQRPRIWPNWASVSLRLPCGISPMLPTKSRKCWASVGSCFSTGAAGSSKVSRRNMETGNVRSSSTGGISGMAM